MRVRNHIRLRIGFILAGMFFGGFAGSLHATIIWSGPVDHSLPHLSDDSIDNSLSISMGEVDDSFRILDEREGFALSGMFETSYATFYSDDFFIVSAFDFGFEIHDSDDWQNLASRDRLARYEEDHPTPGNFFDQSDKYMAVRILDEDEALYGWVRTSHSMEDEEFIIHDWAWNSEAGEPILAGEVPEPAMVGWIMGVFAFAGALYFRRRKRANFPTHCILPSPNDGVGVTWHPAFAG